MAQSQRIAAAAALITQHSMQQVESFSRPFLRSLKHLAGTLVLGLLGSVAPILPAAAQTSADLLRDASTPGDVLVYGMGYSAQRFSPLEKINRSNVHRLVPKWALSLGDSRGAEGQPLFHAGVLYMTTHDATVAVDALTGRQLWRASHEYSADTLRVVCCGIVNRGVAIYEGKIVRALLDSQVLALDAKSGRELWRVRSPAPATAANGYSMTGAPLVVDGVVIVGVAGADYGHRGFVEGYEVDTGRHLWRHWNVPAPGEPGAETWPEGASLVGGGSAWVTGSYDAETGLVYWGTGNPSPWNARGRPGDNLYTNSVIALRPRTGERVWHYQATPNDPFDWDGVSQPVIASIPVDGQKRKVVMQANRNGFFYVLDANTGRLLAANAFGRVNWADGVDLRTGRPRVTQVFRDALAGVSTEVWPDLMGVTNWMHMSFSPISNTVFVNAINIGMTYQAPDPMKYAAGQPSGPGSIRRKRIETSDKGYLKALDPMTGHIKWQIPYASPNFASTMVTAGGIVFNGVMTGEVEARDVDTGRLLWSFQTGSGIVGQPITWEMNGRQFVTIPSGIGGLYALRSGDPNLANVPAGSSLWTFELFDR